LKFEFVSDFAIGISDFPRRRNYTCVTVNAAVRRMITFGFPAHAELNSRARLRASRMARPRRCQSGKRQPRSWHGRPARAYCV